MLLTQGLQYILLVPGSRQCCGPVYIVVTSYERARFICVHHENHVNLSWIYWRKALHLLAKAIDLHQWRRVHFQNVLHEFASLENSPYFEICSVRLCVVVRVEIHYFSNEHHFDKFSALSNAELLPAVEQLDTRF